MVAIPPLRILAADDDARMREFYGVVIQHLGHAVVGVAADGYSLVELGLRVEGPIDLIVSDLRMPVMGGLQAACIIAESRPVHALFVSAFPEDLLALKVDLPFPYHYLIKPVGLADLATEIPVAARLGGGLDSRV